MTKQFTSPISKQEILDAVIDRIIMECSKDEGTTPLEFYVPDPDVFRTDLKEHLTLREMPYSEFESGRIRCGLAVIKITAMTEEELERYT